MTMIINAFGFSGQNRPTVDTLAWTAIILQNKIALMASLIAKGVPLGEFSGNKVETFCLTNNNISVIYSTYIKSNFKCFRNVLNENSRETD